MPFTPERTAPMRSPPLTSDHAVDLEHLRRMTLADHALQREVLAMKIWNELTFAEIASALEISQNTAASRYRYALAALKKNLPSA